MSKPPPTNLMDWPKARLATEVARLRAIMYEHAEQPADPPTSGGGLVDVAGDPHARGGVVIDARKSVLMDEIDVSLVDTKYDEPPRMVMLLHGRVNFTDRRARQLYMFGADGAAALATQLVALAGRAGGEFAAEFRAAFEQRMEEMP
jgi:hypothetical protein